MKADRKPWGSLFRNRRGALCTACVSLIGVLAVVLGTWAACCLHDWTLRPLPDGTTPLVGLILGTGFFKYRDDRIAEQNKPAA